MAKATVETIRCPRCNGTGFVSPRLSRGNDNDICYQCKGSRTISFKVPDAKVVARREAKKEAARLVRVAEKNTRHAANLEAFAVEFPDLAMALDAIPGEIGLYARYHVGEGRVVGAAAAEFVERSIRQYDDFENRKTA